MKKTKKLSQVQLRNLINEVSRPKKTPSLADLLFEEDTVDMGELAASADAKPVTLVVLYGPPAAGKGAAKKAVGEFAGVDADQNFSDWLDSMSKDEAGQFFQEEDELMVNAMTSVLPPLVFKEIAARVEGGEDFDQVVVDYFHVNETGKEFDLSDVLSKSAFEKILKDAGGDVGKAAEEFANFPNTQAYFTQARGFSKQIDGASSELNSVLGATTDDGKTLGVRAMAAGKYMEKVKEEVLSMGATEVGDTTYASVYLMDQAGESSADTGRIEALGKLKEDPDFPSVTLIGIYIYQPQERTEIANLHRAATGGRRVSSNEVDRIFQTAPKIEDGSITDKGPAIEAMESADFDQIHVYFPPDPFEPDDAKEFSQQICQPLGPGTGALDIEGCEEEGNTTSARSLSGMEKQAAKKADIETDDGHLPAVSELNDEQKEKVVKALQGLGFKAEVGDLEEYLENIAPSNVRGASKHGKTPWAGELFGKGTNPTERITVKQQESRVKRVNRDDLVLERWRVLAGIIEN